LHRFWCTLEQLRGEAVRRRADVYALGCLLFEALTGRVPFGGANPAAMLFARLSTRPPRVTVEVHGVPAALDAVIARALATEPRQRFATAGDLAAAGSAALDAAPISAADNSGPATAAALEVRSDAPTSS
jgi:serine/threonine protein kinase